MSEKTLKIIHWFAGIAHMCSALITVLLQGLQTYLATSYKENATADMSYSAAANETWQHYPDDSPQRSWYPGDSRAALAPFLAFQALGDKPFRWLFYGDDDTLFFLPAAKYVVQDLDPEIPYFLTGARTSPLS